MLWLKVPLCSHQAILSSLLLSSPLSILPPSDSCPFVMHSSLTSLLLPSLIPRLTIHLFPLGEGQRMRQMLTQSSDIIKCLNQQVFISSKFLLPQENNPHLFKPQWVGLQLLEAKSSLTNRIAKWYFLEQRICKQKPARGALGPAGNTIFFSHCAKHQSTIFKNSYGAVIYT